MKFRHFGLWGRGLSMAWLGASSAPREVHFAQKPVQHICSGRGGGAHVGKMYLSEVASITTLTTPIIATIISTTKARVSSIACAIKARLSAKPSTSRGTPLGTTQGHTDHDWPNQLTPQRPLGEISSHLCDLLCMSTLGPFAYECSVWLVGTSMNYTPAQHGCRPHCEP
eukprot:3635355-Alexandrium_andersonii.AAC.1